MLCNITEGCSALLLCSIIGGYSALLLCNITEDCSATSICSTCSATSQKAAQPCLLCNIIEGCSTLPTLQHHRDGFALPTLQHHRDCSTRLICSTSSATSQRAALLYLLCNIKKTALLHQSALPTLQHQRWLLCPAFSTTSQRAALPYLLCNITEGYSATSQRLLCSAYSTTSQRLLCYITNLCEQNFFFLVKCSL